MAVSLSRVEAFVWTAVRSSASRTSSGKPAKSLHARLVGVVRTLATSKSSLSSEVRRDLGGTATERMLGRLSNVTMLPTATVVPAGADRCTNPPAVSMKT